MRKWADVRAHCDGNAGSELPFKFADVQVKQLTLPFGSFGGVGVIREIFGYGESRDGEDLFFAHDAHGFVAQLIGMVDGFDASAGCVESSRLTGGVDCNAIACARGLAHGGNEFVLGVLEWSGEVPTHEGILSGLVNLDEVRTFLDLFADDGDELRGVIGVSRVGKHVLLWVVADGVFVPTENVDGIAAGAQARSGNLAPIDGVADGCVCGACAFGAHVALSSESRHKVVASGEGGRDGALGNRFLDGLKVFRAGVKEEMDVRVDKAGEKSGVTKVNDFGAGGAGDFGSDLGYGVARDQDFAWSCDLAGFDVEQARGVEDDCAGAWRRLGRR